MKNYLIVIEEAEENFSAYSPDVDGCIATGDTPEEARKNFIEALEFHIEGLTEEGLEVPQPSTKFAFCSEDCSGVLNVRVKKSLHFELIKLAEQEGVSVSHLVNDALVEKYLTQKVDTGNIPNSIDSMKFLESMTKIYAKNGRLDLAEGLKSNIKVGKTLKRLAKVNSNLTKEKRVAGIGRSPETGEFIKTSTDRTTDSTQSVSCSKLG